MPPNQSRSALHLRMARISSAGVRLAASTLEQPPHLVAERDRLGRAREHAAALGDLGLVVVLPARARQIEQALALGKGRGAGIGVDEDVAVIEGRHQLDVLGQQHAVAEHVARHVADADHAERLLLDVDVHLAEVALDALPGAARGDRHALVVVAGRAAGGERIAEPEVVRGARCRWRCRRRWRCPCRPRPPGRGRRRRGAPRGAAARSCRP